MHLNVKKLMIKIKNKYRLTAHTVDINIKQYTKLKQKNKKQETTKINNKQQKP